MPEVRIELPTPMDLCVQAIDYGMKIVEKEHPKHWSAGYEYSVLIVGEHDEQNAKEIMLNNHNKHKINQVVKADGLGDFEWSLRLYYRVLFPTEIHSAAA